MRQDSHSIAVRYLSAKVELKLHIQARVCLVLGSIGIMEGLTRHIASSQDNPKTIELSANNVSLDMRAPSRVLGHDHACLELIER